MSLQTLGNLGSHFLINGANLDLTGAFFERLLPAYSVTDYGTILKIKGLSFHLCLPSIWGPLRFNHMSRLPCG
jgi:hypothetical protein